MRKLKHAAIALIAVSSIQCSSSSDPEAASPDTPVPVGEAPVAPGEAGCALVKDGFGPEGGEDVRLEKVLDGLEVPWAIAFLSESEWLVTERPGRIRRVVDGSIAPDPVATVEAGESGEGGLLGIAAHPDFAINRFFYVYYTFEKDGDEVNRVERFTLSEDGASAVSDRVIIDDIPAGVFHNGGRIKFGPDGMLYVGTGDAREPDLSQDDSNLAGKILRITPEGEVPSDNPVAGNPYYVKGIRNTQGFDWLDADTLIVSDHGPSGELGRSGHDELTLASPGANLGWPTVYRCETSEGLTAPSLVWSEALPPGGALLYSGERIPSWKGDILIAALAAEHLQRVSIGEDGGLSGEAYFRGEHGRLREVVQAPDGNVYVTTSNCDGRGDCGSSKDSILRLVPSP